MNNTKNLTIIESEALALDLPTTTKELAKLLHEYYQEGLYKGYAMGAREVEQATEQAKQAQEQANLNRVAKPLDK